MKILEITLPQYFYHGTARGDLAFHPNAVAYFASRFEDARDHAIADSSHEGGTPHVIEVRLDGVNPVRLPERLMQDLHFMPEVVLRLRQAGYDAAIGRKYSGEIAVLDSSKIQVNRIVAVIAEPTLQRRRWMGEQPKLSEARGPAAGPLLKAIYTR